MTTPLTRPKNPYVLRCAPLLSFGLAVGCLIDNPEHSGLSSTSTSSTSSTASSSAEVTTGSQTSAGTVTEQGTSTTPTATTGPESGGVTSSSSPTGSSTESSSSGTVDSADSTLEPGDLGLPCAASSQNCEMLASGAECCTAPECLDTCMVACLVAPDCPFDNMGCEHGYCLFECTGDDDDCITWPGFTCQHTATYCENDELP
ncbi:MAG: hypothetical protein ACRBN8_46215 [Nannocystales bacterium]